MKPMNNNEQGTYPDEVEQLLFEKEYQGLTKHERQTAMKHIHSQENYRAERNLRTRMSQAIKLETLGFVPDPGIELRLLNTLEASSRGRQATRSSMLATLIDLWSPNLAAYRVGLVSIVLVVGIWIGSNPELNWNLMNSGSSEFIADTSYQISEDTSGFDTRLYMP